MPYPTLDQLVAANPQWRSQVPKPAPAPKPASPPKPRAPKARGEEQRERIREYMRGWRAKNREKLRKYEAERRKRVALG